jgi:glutamine amidotransferase
MCIAIVKAKGNAIPEEHLENGWKANDDGAGFAYVGSTGEIVIEKFMTWEEFLPSYRLAVETYGDTSDFLIHFRITSKGTTDLDNCHPFYVDRDRAIIHNGTMTDVVIEKKDTRSDTRVLAEEYLPQLPEDWEDNWVITTFLESFIGWSKICMLHRTKGIYIFNENRGTWVEGNWYSNDTYKPKAVTTYFGNTGRNWTNSGFYSYKLSKWIDETEAEKYTYAERQDHTDWNKYEKDYLTKRADGSGTKVWKSCDSCHTLCEKEELYPHVTATGATEQWCCSCMGELETCLACNKDFSARDTDEYWNPEIQDFVPLCDACHDFLKVTTGIELESKFAHKRSEAL